MNRQTAVVIGAAVTLSLLMPTPYVLARAQVTQGAGSCATGQLQQLSGSGPARPLRGSVPVVFIHGILSTSAMWDGSSSTSLAGQVAGMQGKAWQGRGPTAWTFNYGPKYNLDWVSNPVIGPAFARAISCLAQVSGHQVVIVAHSMGGLAAQFAAGQRDPYGGLVADHVAEVITIGTPYQGSWLLSAFQALRTGAHFEFPVAYLAAAQAITSACAGSKAGICGLLSVPPSPVGTALQLNSAAIHDLPAWMPGLRVYDVAGDIRLIQVVAGPLSGSVDIGDVVVLPDSATAYDTTSNGKPFYENCGAETLWNLVHVNGGPCYHVSLPTNPDVVQAVLTAIRARISDALLPGWALAKIAPGPITSVSCSGLFCVAVGAAGSFGHRQGYALTYSGGAWSGPTALGTGDSYTVSCASPASCVAVTDTGYAYTLHNDAWSAAADIYPAANRQNGQFSTSDAVKDVSCASNNFCVAVTAQGRALTWNGTGWSAPGAIGLPGIPPPAPPSAEVNAGISCPTATFCLTGTALQSTAAIWNGTRWSSTSTPLNGAYWSASCTGQAFCMIAGGAHATGDISSVWNGQSWSALTHPAGEGPALGFDRTSCLSAGFCLATDAGAGVNGQIATTARGGGIFVWAHDTWTGPVFVDPSSGAALDALSCSPGGLCVAADTAGRIYANPAITTPAATTTLPSTSACPTSAQLLTAWNTAPATLRHSWVAPQVTGFTGIGCWQSWVVTIPTSTSPGNGVVVFSQAGTLHLITTTELQQQFRSDVCSSPNSPPGWTSPPVVSCP